MSDAEAVLQCTFGFGKICRVFAYTIEIAGKKYLLEDLTAIYPTYRKVLGVASARIELAFGTRRVILRGIADQEIARQLVDYLLASRPDHPSIELSVRLPRGKAARARELGRAQASVWERTAVIPAISSKDADEVAANASSDEQPASLNGISPERPSAELSLDELSMLDLDNLDVDDVSLAPAGEVTEPLDTESLLNFAQHPTPIEALVDLKFDTPDPVSNETSDTDKPSPDGERNTPPPDDSPWPVVPGLPGLPRLQPQFHSVRLVNPAQSRQDSLPMPSVPLKASALPVIHVPIRLQPGECAHYSIGSSLCGEHPAGAEQGGFAALDHGLLILTNRRIIYTGKDDELIVPYANLAQVTRLVGAIALNLQGQFRRIVIELEHPQEWAMKIEQLAFISQRARPRSARPLLASAALPGLNNAPGTGKQTAVYAQGTMDMDQGAQMPVMRARPDQQPRKVPTRDMQMVPLSQHGGMEEVMTLLLREQRAFAETGDVEDPEDDDATQHLQRVRPKAGFPAPIVDAEESSASVIAPISKSAAMQPSAALLTVTVDQVGSVIEADIETTALRLGHMADVRTMALRSDISTPGASGTPETPGELATRKPALDTQIGRRRGQTQKDKK